VTLTRWFWKVQVGRLERQPVLRRRRDGRDGSSCDIILKGIEGIKSTSDRPIRWGITTQGHVWAKTSCSGGAHRGECRDSCSCF
jgi:hypothetical protein